MSAITIRKIKTILTAPRGIDLVVVKVETSEPGLYGLGCATFTQRYLAVASAVEEYLKPLLEGRCVDDIEDIWQSAMGSSYWRNGPVLNNAISGVDEALWDIKGKLANMPVYELFGGKCREAAAVYRHTDGSSPEEVEENVLRYLEEGYRYLRCQMGTYGGQMGKGSRQLIVSPENSKPGAYFDPAQYCESTVRLFAHLREKVGYGVELLHDVHERLTPIQALNLAKQLEPYRLFFLEDALPPEQVEWFERFRSQTAVPLAMGELFNNPLEWKDLISRRLIDYIRVHLSQIGGLTPARKLAALCEAFGVRTAWHGPGDLSPVGRRRSCTWTFPPPISESRSFPAFPKRNKRCSRAVQRSETAISMQIQSRAWAWIWTKRRLRSIRAATGNRAGFWRVPQTGPLCGHNFLKGAFSIGVEEKNSGKAGNFLALEIGSGCPGSLAGLSGG